LSTVQKVALGAGLAVGAVAGGVGVHRLAQDVGAKTAAPTVGAHAPAGSHLGNAAVGGATAVNGLVAGAFIKDQIQGASTALKSNAPADQKAGAVLGAAAGTAMLAQGANDVAKGAVTAAKATGAISTAAAKTATTALGSIGSKFLGPAGDIASIGAGAANMKSDVQAVNQAFHNGGSTSDKVAAVASTVSDGLNIASGTIGAAGDALIASGVGAPIGVLVKGASVVTGVVSAAAGAIAAEAPKVVDFFNHVGDTFKQGAAEIVKNPHGKAAEALSLAAKKP
jgi:hypothetical protein